MAHTSAVVSPEAAAVLRRDLRTAVTNYATDHSTLAQLLQAIERVAKYACGQPCGGFKEARRPLRKLVKSNAPYMFETTGLVGWRWPALYEAVRTGRNDTMHSGTAAALTGTRAVTLALVLMEALMNHRADTEKTVGQLMVSNPVCAESWQTLADVRRTMLTNDYTALPLRDGGCREPGTWKILSAECLGRYLVEDRERMKETVGQTRLHATPTPTATPSTPVKEAEELPLVVVENGRLLGIVTAFDLL